MNDDELKRILEGLVEAPAIILDSSPLCRGFDAPRLTGTPAQLSREGVKVYPISIPAAYDVHELEEAGAQGKSIFEEYTARHEAMLAAMRERELEEQAEEAMAFFQSLGEAPEHPRGRIFEATNADGERVVYVMPEPERIELKIPMSFDLPKPDPMRFLLGQRLGGLVRRDRIDPIITVTSVPMPKVPGVEAMLEDGWVWTGWRFARDPEPTKEWAAVVVVGVEDYAEGSGDSVFVRTRPAGHPAIGKYRRDDAGGEAVLIPELRWIEFWQAGSAGAHHGLEHDEWLAKVGKRTTVAPGRYASFVSEGRVRSGRYSNRPPTNRKRKRERAKSRRRERKKNRVRACVKHRAVGPTWNVGQK